jgi:hypothetical protein
MARMSWTRFAATVSAAVLAGWSVSASASDDYARSGPYVGIGALYAFEEFSGDAGHADSTWGYHLAGGYRFNEYFALEVTGEQYLNFDTSGGGVDVSMAAVSGKLYPFQGIVQPYLAAGAGWAWIDDDRGTKCNDFAARFAGGVEFYLARNWVLFTEVGYFLPTSTGSDYDVVPLSFGAQYRFF